MKRAVLLAIAMLITVFARPASAASTAHIIVRTTSPTVHATAGTGATVVNRIDDSTQVVAVPNATPARAAAQFKSKKDVVYAEPDIEYHATAAPNDPCYSTACVGSATQWGFDKIGLPSAWTTTTGRKSITIGIVDSGIDAGHPDLNGHVTVGPNYSSDSNTDDLYGHGTHVAGIAGALTNNGVGVAGGDPNANIVSIKVLNANGIGTASGIAKGIRYAADNGERIINLSLGATGYSQTMADAVSYAQSRGALVICAADNASTSTPSYPAALPGVVAVGASTPSDRLASFSNYGSWVDLLAPGTGIISTWPRAMSPSNPYSVEDGTSMATPLVTATAALVWSENPYLSAQGVAQRLFATTDPIQGDTSVATYGRLDAAKALSGLPSGYRAVASDGGVFSYGYGFYGSTGGHHLNKPIVGAMTSGDPYGYRLVASDGGVFCYGDAAFYGSTGGIKLNKPIVGSAVSGSGSGYWLVASDGGVFSFGDAPFFGSTGAIHLNKPIVAIVPTATGRGYWLVASDGGVFSFGDADFHGSTGGMSLNKPIVGAARTPDGNGYWLIASDGGVFSFGDSTFYGSTGAISLTSPIVSVVPSSTGSGYWLVAADGGIFAFGDSEFMGSTGGQKLNASVVAGF